MVWITTVSLRQRIASTILPFVLGWLPPVAADVDASEPGFQSLDQQVQQLKQKVIELNRDLFVLEEELLFPSNTQIAVFVSLDVGEFFNIDSVQIRIDDEVVSNYLYTKREVDALHRGGVHRIYTGNLKAGEHELIALVVGKGPQGRDYRRGATLKFHKKLGPKYVELKVMDNAGAHQPNFEFQEW